MSFSLFSLPFRRLLRETVWVLLQISNCASVRRFESKCLFHCSRCPSGASCGKPFGNYRSYQIVHRFVGLSRNVFFIVLVALQAPLAGNRLGTTDRIKLCIGSSV